MSGHLEAEEVHHVGRVVGPGEVAGVPARREAQPRLARLLEDLHQTVGERIGGRAEDRAGPAVAEIDDAFEETQEDRQQGWRQVQRMSSTVPAKVCCPIGPTITSVSSGR